MGPKGNILSLTDNGFGYLKVKVNGGRTRKVQQLVAQAFLGPKPDGMDVAHRNGEKHDNRACNLVYASRKGNCLHRRFHGTAPCPLVQRQRDRLRARRLYVSRAKYTPAQRRIIQRESGRQAGALWRGEQKPGAKLTEKAVREIKAALRAGRFQSEVATDYRVSRSLIGRISRGEKWRHVAP